VTLTRLSQNTLLLLISSFGGALLLFALSALIGRALGSEALGVYAVALAWVYPLSLGAEFGLTALMTREIGVNIAALPAYMNAITRARLLIGGTLMIGLYAAAPLISRDPAVVIGLQVSAPLLIIQPFYSQFTTVFKVVNAMRLIPALNLGMIAAQVTLTGVTLACGGTIIHALILNTLTSAGQLTAAWLLYRQFARKQQGADLRLIPLLRAALPFGLAGVFAALQARVVFVFLQSSMSEAGYFSAANRFSEAAKLLPNALFGALFPLIGSPGIQAVFRRAEIALTAFGLTAGIAFTVIAPSLLVSIFGTSFAAAIPALIILGWSLLFVALRGVKTLDWYAQGAEQFVNRVNALAVALILALSLAFIPTHGAAGAALAVLLTEMCAVGLLYGAARR
jgi:O-antigen/teichoic acid export membrane protein